MLSTLLKDTWEELDPDELSYEVNCVLDPSAFGGALFFPSLF